MEALRAAGGGVPLRGSTPYAGEPAYPLGSRRAPPTPVRWPDRRGSPHDRACRPGPCGLERMIDETPQKRPHTPKPSPYAVTLAHEASRGRTTIRVRYVTGVGSPLGGERHETVGKKRRPPCSARLPYDTCLHGLQCRSQDAQRTTASMRRPIFMHGNAAQAMIGYLEKIELLCMRCTRVPCGRLMLRAVRGVCVATVGRSPVLCAPVLC